MTAKKKATKKKAVKKKATKKKTAKKKATKKKAARKKTGKKQIRTARQAFHDTLKSVQQQLPPAAARRVAELRKAVNGLERQSDRARADFEKRLHKAEMQIRKDAVKVLRRIERAIEPPRKPRRKVTTGAKK